MVEKDFSTIRLRLLRSSFSNMVAEKDSIYDALMTLVSGSPNGSLDHNIGILIIIGAVVSDGIIAELQSALDYQLVQSK